MSDREMSMHQFWVAAVVNEFHQHQPTAESDATRPYKTVCECGRAAYEYKTHLAEVAVEAIESWLDKH